MATCLRPWTKVSWTSIPSTGSSTVITAFHPDGVSVSPNGKTVYGVFGGNGVVGFDIATHAQVFNSGSMSGGPDGTGVISGSALNGRIVVNMNDGTVLLIDPANPDNSTNRTIIATGGTRGDFTSPDSNDGSLFLAFTDATYRLKIAGGTIGGPAVPEPTSLTVLGIGVAGLFGYGWRRRKQVIEREKVSGTDIRKI